MRHIIGRSLARLVVAGIVYLFLRIPFVHFGFNTNILALVVAVSMSSLWSK